MDLTILDIENDIARFQSRISSAREKLAALPGGYLPYQKHKERTKNQRGLKAEVVHNEQLIVYAEEGISIRKGESDYVRK